MDNTVSISAEKNSAYKIQRLAIISAMVIFAVLVLLRDIVNIGVSKIIFIVIASMLFLLIDKKGIYNFIAFLTPLSTGLPLKYIVAIALIVVILKQRFFRLDLGAIICMVLILLIELLSFYRGNFNIIEYLRFIGIFVFAFLCMSDLKQDYDYEGIVKFFTIGFWVAVISIFGQMLNEYSLEQLLTLNIRFGNTKGALGLIGEGMRVSYNPNGLGSLCLITIFTGLILNRNNKKLLYILSIIFAILVGIMTQSRAFILVFVIGIMLYTLFACENFLQGFKIVAIFSISALIVVFIIKQVIPSYFEALIGRFDVDDVTNGRMDIIEYYFDEMFKYVDRVIFGVGLQNYNEKYNYEFSAHNATQEIMITWGVIGLLLVVLLLVFILRNALNHNHRVKAVQYAPFIVFLLALQAGQGFSNYDNMLRLMIVYSIIAVSIKEKKSKKSKNNFNG